ncbi:MAG: heptaprenyl diphosphate synthase component II [Bacillaceae bacterium]
MKLQMLYSFLEKDVKIVEEELKNVIKCENEDVATLALPLLQAGGKRIRPLFVLLSAKLGKYDINQVKHVAVALELIHMASLVHDDIIDGALLRRGAPTIHSQYGNQMAMCVGDFLFAKALECVTRIEDPRLHQILSNTIVELCLGEVEQIKDKYNFTQNLRCYLRRIRRKTAILIAASCEIGAVCAECPTDIQRAMYWYGYYVGMSYQIMDDVLDFVASEQQLGKPAGGDLVQGNITLPTLFALKDRQYHDRITAVSTLQSPVEIGGLIHDMAKSPYIEESIVISERYLQKAISKVEQLDRSVVKSTLLSIAKYIGKRKF